MKATCPNCSTAYRIADEKIPDIGAKINCPKCGNLFVVRRNASAAVGSAAGPASDPPLFHEQATPLQSLTDSPAPVPPSFFPAATPSVPAPAITPQAQPSSHAEGLPPDRSRQIRGVSAIRAQSGVAPKKTPEDESVPVSTSVFGAPSGRISSADRVPIKSGTLPAKTRAGVWLWLADILSTLLLLILAIVTVTRYGILDLSSVFPLRALGIEPPKSAAKQAADSANAPRQVEPAQAYINAMEQAQAALRSKRFSKAALEFSRALSARPESREALEGLAKSYEGLGDDGRAQVARKKMESIAPTTKQGAP